MKSILIRLGFGIIILVVNILIILIVGNPQVPLFSDYAIDLRVLIPFLGLLFLDPFISLFNPFFCSVKILNSTKESDDELKIVHRIEYRGKEPLIVTIEILSSCYNVECEKGESKEMFIPQQTNIHLSKEKPNETLTFRLKRKEAHQGTTNEKKATIKYKRNYLTKKIDI